MAQAALTNKGGAPAAPASISDTFATKKPRSLWVDAWSRMKRNRGSILGLIIVGIFLLIAIFAPLIAPHPPQLSYPGKTYLQAAWVQLPKDPAHSGTAQFPLGTDSIGRDVLSRVIYGARTSMAVGFIPLTVILLIGMLIGLTAGFFGGQVDNLLMRFTDIIYAFPDLLFFIIMITALRDTWIGNLFNGFVLLFVSLALVSWTGVARLMRGQVLSLKEKEFVEAAKSIGATSPRIMLKHILPNSLTPIIVASAFIVPAAILQEAILGFLGIGIRPSTDPNAAFPTSWGSMLLDGKIALSAQNMILIAPLVCVALIMLAFTFIGDGLRDALDPRSEK